MKTICNKCGIRFRQVWRPEHECFTSFKECPSCRANNAIHDFDISDKQIEIVTEILELVGKQQFTIKEIREVLSQAVYHFERNIERTVISDAKRYK